MSTIIVYDLEIQTPIDNVKVKWADHDKMGISVGCAYDYNSGEYKVFMEDNLQELVDLLNASDLVVAFNHIGFDNPLLRATGKNLNLARQLKPDAELKLYDLLLESRKGSGWKEGDRFPTGFKLDDHLRATFGERLLKTEDGAQAPVMWQNAQLGKLISYCLADVHRERLLFESVWETGKMSNKKGVQHPVRTPQSILGIPPDKGLANSLRNPVV